MLALGVGLALPLTALAEPKIYTFADAGGAADWLLSDGSGIATEAGYEGDAAIVIEYPHEHAPAAFAELDAREFGKSFRIKFFFKSEGDRMRAQVGDVAVVDDHHWVLPDGKTVSDAGHWLPSQWNEIEISSENGSGSIVVNGKQLVGAADWNEMLKDAGNRFRVSFWSGAASSATLDQVKIETP